MSKVYALFKWVDAENECARSKYPRQAILHPLPDLETKIKAGDQVSHSATCFRKVGERYV